MKRFLLLMLAATSLVACSSCTNKATDPIVVDGNVPGPSATATTPPPVDVTMHVVGTHWELTLPSKDWIMMLEDVPENATVLVNIQQQNVILVEDKEFSGNLESLALETLRDLRGAGATVVSAKQVSANGHNFVLIDSFKGDDKAVVWVTQQGSHSVGFHCGGTSKFDQAALCKSLFSNFKLKD